MELDLHSPTPDLVTLLNSISVGVFTLDAQGSFAGWSDGATRIMGFSQEEVRGKDCAFLDADEGGQTLSELWEQVLRGDAFSEGPVSLRGKDGQAVYMLGDIRRLETAGEFVGAVGVLTNLTLHMLANRRLAHVEPQAVSQQHFQEMVGESPTMQEVFAEIQQVAHVDVTVLVRGETGTGKELAARAIHALSTRRSKPLVCVNCSAIPDTLLESELFGHVRGAFTGALRDKKGVFEEANGGVLFLDEIGDLGPAVQVKLLRAIEEREIRRVGGERPTRVDVRVVSATHRDLAAMVAAGTFREDLYYRLRVFELSMPPLRERQGDVRVLVEHFISRFSIRHKKMVRAVSGEAFKSLEGYPWPGNVRELRNAIEYAFVRVKGDEILPRDLPPEMRSGERIPETLPLPPSVASAPPSPPGLGAEEADERIRIIAALRETGGGKTAAARLLGMSRVTLWKRIKKYQISPVYEGL